MSTHERRVVLTWRRCSRAGGDHRRGCSRRISAPAPPPTETPGGGTTPAGRPGPQTRRSHPSSTAPPTGAPSSTAPDFRPTRTARTASNGCSTTEKTISAVHSLPESRTPRGDIGSESPNRPGVAHHLVHRSRTPPGTGQGTGPVCGEDFPYCLKARFPRAGRAEAPLTSGPPTRLRSIRPALTSPSRPSSQRGPDAQRA
jgi:hypothetical protein